MSGTGPDRLDALARAMAAPMTRRRALLVAVAGLVGASLPSWLAPAAAPAQSGGCGSLRGTQRCLRAANVQFCCFDIPLGAVLSPPNGCFDPRTHRCCGGPLRGEGQTAWTCPIDATCAPDGGDEPNCILPTCKYRDLVNNKRQRPYSPSTECCTPRGVQPREEGWDYPACAQTRVKRPGYRPTVNGCGVGRGVPQGFGKASFRPACNAHDICYGTCNKEKEACDGTFRDALDDACSKAYPGPRNAALRKRCGETAEIYTGAVGFLGSSAYVRAQEEACICCPAPFRQTPE